MAFATFFERARTAVGPYLEANADSLESLLSDRAPSIVLGGEPVVQSRWIAELSVNLLARLYPRLHLSAPPAERERLVALATSINPQLEILEGVGAPELTIAIEASIPGGLHASSDGWVASVLGAPADGERGPPNPFSAGAAACLAVAELFRRVALPSREEPFRDTKVSLLDFSAQAGRDWALPAQELRSLCIVGAGAVGSAALWALARHPKLGGTCWVVDDEAIELSNLQRYVLAFQEHVGTDKVQLARHALETAGLQVETRRLPLAEFADEFPDGFPCETVLVSVDNVETRRAAQALLPRLVVNGFTGDRSLGASWHELDRAGACLACLYQPQGAAPSESDLVGAALGLPPQRAAVLLMTGVPLSPDELANAERHLGTAPGDLAAWAGKPVRDLYVGFVCGGASVPIPKRGRSEVVPLAHQSVLAGILMAAELVKRTNPELRARAQTQPLVVWHDAFRRPPSQWCEPRMPAVDCICQDDDYREVYAEKWLAAGERPSPLAADAQVAPAGASEV